MNTIDKNTYESWKSKQNHPYSKEIFSYAECWAELMEAELARGAVLENIALKTSREADRVGVSGFVYGAAVLVLSRCWVYGKELGKWDKQGALT